jgi:hypothetical protein
MQPNSSQGWWANVTKIGFVVLTGRWSNSTRPSPQKIIIFTDGEGFCAFYGKTKFLRNLLFKN